MNRRAAAKAPPVPLRLRTAGPRKIVHGPTFGSRAVYSSSTSLRHSSGNYCNSLISTSSSERVWLCSLGSCFTILLLLWSACEFTTTTTTQQTKRIQRPDKPSVKFEWVPSAFAATTLPKASNTEQERHSFRTTVQLPELQTTTHFIRHHEELTDRGRKKYNHLDLHFLKSDKYQRKVAKNDEKLHKEFKDDQLADMDEDMGDYYLHFDERSYPRQCVQPDWTDLSFPVCNTFHETELVESERYLAHGHYRDTFLYSDYVLKRLRVHFNFEYGVLNQIRTEALVMERLSVASTTTNIYGFCGGSLAVEIARDITEDIVPFTSHQTERGRITQGKMEELQAIHSPTFSFNNFTAIEKLDIALAMAEGVAEMHGFKSSVIVNDDVHPDQWLITADGRVILNDMNNARFLQWDWAKKKYCKYYSSYGGDFRAPEEYVGSFVDETVDIPPIANLLFSLLTGLWPYYDIHYKERKRLQKLAIEGVPPEIPSAYANQSLIEKRLVELMFMCYEREPSKRVDVFYIVKHLRHTKHLHETSS